MKTDTLKKVWPTLELPQRAQYTWPPHQTWPVVPLAGRWYQPWIRVITYYHVNLIFTVTEHQHWLPAPNVSVIYSVPFSSFIPWHIFNITILTMSDGKISGLLPSSLRPIPSMHFIGIKWKNVIRSWLYSLFYCINLSPIMYVNSPQSLIQPPNNIVMYCKVKL